jgi:hypothetical protein
VQDRATHHGNGMEGYRKLFLALRASLVVMFPLTMAFVARWSDFHFNLSNFSMSLAMVVPRGLIMLVVMWGMIPTTRGRSSSATRRRSPTRRSWRSASRSSPPRRRKSRSWSGCSRNGRRRDSPAGNRFAAERWRRVCVQIADNDRSGGCRRAQVCRCGIGYDGRDATELRVPIGWTA